MTLHLLFANVGTSQELGNDSNLDTAIIDSLIEKSERFYSKDNEDSAKYYATLAYQKSIPGYPYGAARSLLYLSMIAKHFSDDFVKAEQLGKESLKWYQKSKNQQGIDTLLASIITSLTAQSRWKESAKYSNLLFNYAERSGSAPARMDAMLFKFAIYVHTGDYKNAFETSQKTLEFAEGTGYKPWISVAFHMTAIFYIHLEDYEHALSYFRKMLQIDDQQVIQEREKNDDGIWFKTELAETYSHLGKFDSANLHLNTIDLEKDQHQLRIFQVSKGLWYYLQKDYTNALKNFEPGLKEHRRLHDVHEVMRTLSFIGYTKIGLQKFHEAIQCARESLQIAFSTNTKPQIRNAYHILYLAYDNLKRFDSANHYFRLYIKMKDEVLNQQTKGRVAGYDYEQKIAKINLEKQQQEARLRQQATIKKIIIGGIVGIIILAISLILMINQKRKNEKAAFTHSVEVAELEKKTATAELQRAAAELEMKALRAQMNPHFIFNSLNSINRFILENNKSEASIYLTKFSKLVRMILQNSQSPLISLDAELETLDLYLQMESLRVSNKFKYFITVSDDIDPAEVKIPPLVIQPYVENAIWHGLMPKPEPGHLSIDLFQEDEQLIIKIKDDGIGRKKAAELNEHSPSSHKSYGMKLTEDRIESQHESRRERHVTITDLVFPDGTPAGTEVLIKLPIFPN